MQLVPIDQEWRDDVDLVAVLTEPLRAARTTASKREVEADHPAPKVHHRREPIDELLRRERRQLAIESHHDGVLYARRLDQRELFLQGCDRLRAVGGVEDGARMWFEGDERRLGAVRLCGSDHMLDHVDVPEVDAIEASDRERHSPDRARGKSEMDLQRPLLS